MTGGQDAAGGLDGARADAQAAGRGRRADHRRAPTSRSATATSRRCRPGSRSGTATASTRPSACCARSPGVTVLIYDQRCAAEARRLRKRGALADAHHPRRDQRGGVRGLRRLRREEQLPVGAAGRHRARPQDAHRPDLLQHRLLAAWTGDCPSFVTVECPRRAAAAPRPRRESPRAAARAATSSRPTDADDVFLAGIGGTGIVTVNQVLATAAAPRRAARCAASTRPGCRQKAGPVVSHLRIAPRRRRARARQPGRRGADCYLAFDVLVGGRRRATSATPPRRRRPPSCRPARCPTGSMVARRRGVAAAGRAARWSSAITRPQPGTSSRSTRRPRPTRCSATPCPPTCCSSARPTRPARCPSRPTAIEWAIELNGVAVAANTAGVPLGTGGGRRSGRVRRRDRGAARPIRGRADLDASSASWRGRPGGSRASGRSCSPTTRTPARPVAT